MPIPFDADAERTLVHGVLVGDGAARERFASRLACVPRMLAARNARLGHPLAAEDLRDVTQDVFATVLRRLPDYVADAPLEAWLHGICCLQLRAAVRLRRQQRQRAAELPDEIADRAEPGDRMRDAGEVLRLLERIGGVEGAVVRLRHLEGFTFRQVAAALGMPLNTAKSHYLRGMVSIRRRLEPFAREEAE